MLALEAREWRGGASHCLFTQEDPIGLAGGLNLYGYANGDPINNSDPFGLSACPNGWEQKETADGEPFCFNPETGDIRDDDFDVKEREAAELERTAASCRSEARRTVGAILTDASFVSGIGSTGAASGLGFIGWAGGAAISDDKSKWKWVPGVNTVRAFAREWRVCNGGTQ